LFLDIRNEGIGIMIGLFRNRDLVNDIDRRIRKEFNHTVRLHTLSTDHMEVLKELDFVPP